MKNLKLILMLSVLISVSCKNEKSTRAFTEVIYYCPMNCEVDKTYKEPGSCLMCKMDLIANQQDKSRHLNEGEISDESIFHLTSLWNTHQGEIIQLEELKGKTLVMVMIYTTCKAACPRLVTDMRNIEAQIPKSNIENLRFVLVSIDPTNDTPKRLKEFALENKMEEEQWVFLQGTESGIREFANVLAVKYKQISPLDFSHSNIISVFNISGELIHQQEGLGVDNKETIHAILELTSEN